MNNFSITLKETIILYSFKNLISIITLGNILFIGGYYIYIYIIVYIYIYIYTFVSSFEIINIPCTQSDRIHVYIYIYIHVNQLTLSWFLNFFNINVFALFYRFYNTVLDQKVLTCKNQLFFFS